MIKHYLQPYLLELDAIPNFDLVEVINRYPPKIRDSIFGHILSSNNGRYYFTQALALAQKGLPLYNLFETKKIYHGSSGK